MALIGWWPLDGNTEDYTVNQNHGTPNNVSWVNGKIGQAGSFNGTSSKITVSQVDLLSEWSVSVWIKPVTSEKTYQFLFGNNVVIGNIGRILIRRNGYVAYSYPVNTYKNFSLLTADIVDSWNHLVFVANNNGIDLYLNGIYNSTVSQVDPILNFAMIGNAWNDDNWATEGQINDVRIYDHALSQKEINDLAKAKILNYSFNKDEAIIYDETGYKRNGSKNGSPVWTTDSKFGCGSYSFLNSNISTTGLNIPLSAYTINFSAKFTAYEYMELMTPQAIQFAFKWRTTGQNPYWNSQWTGGNTIGMSYGFTPPLNEWHMYTLVYDGTNFKWFYDGELIGTRTITAGSYPNISSIITSSTSGEYMRGNMDQIQLFTTSLSDADVLDLYQTRIKIDNQGNLYANEIVEDYYISKKLTLNELFTEKQLFKDNDLSSLANWNLISTNDYVYNGNSLTVSQKAGFPTSQITVSQNIQYIVDHKYYFRANVLETDMGDWYIYAPVQGPEYTYNFINVKSNNYTAYFSATNTGIYTTNIGRAVYYNGSYWKSDYVVLFDLTATFGAGNEPSKEQMDTWYKDYITSRPKSSGVVKTREFSETDSPTQPLKIFKDKIQIQGSIKEG